ncbi:MAG TPA: reverse transcriptase-like protein [Anaerolineae bacterium]|nr:reverse transcriptase-like protein [Anaerolineae bacterium]
MATDRVRALAAEIAALPPAERARLYRLLAVREDRPAPTQLAFPSPPDQDSAPPDYVLIFDGGSRGNPGPGYGSYLIRRVRDGAQRLERLDLGDGYTNNEAEYDTLIAALEDLIGRIERAGRRPEEFALEIRGDSALVIHQVQGKWKTAEPRMRERRDRCRELLGRFRSATLKTQPRAESVRLLGH